MFWNFFKRDSVSPPANLKKSIENIQRQLCGVTKEEAFLLLGETKAGKTTLAYHFSNKELISVDNNGELCIRLKDETKMIPDMVISSQKRSETKIPHAITTKSGLVVWDCPGFLDTGNEDVYQDIINAVSIKTLFKKIKRIKFILLVPQKDLKGVAGDFLRSVKSFCELFEKIGNLEYVAKSIGLVITQCRKQLKKINILKEIKKSQKKIKDLMRKPR